MRTIHAIYEKGVFRPIDPVDLPEHTAVEFEPRVRPNGALDEEQAAPPPVSDGLSQIYAILSERSSSGHTDTAARHNEHQP